MIANSAGRQRPESATMRIAYVTEWSPYAETGVLRKLIGQIHAWRDLGCNAQIFSVSPLQDAAPALNFDQVGEIVGHFHQRHLDRFPCARLGYVNKIATVPRLVAQLKRYRPDVIYYRQNGPWYPGVSRLLSVAPTVLEVNTDEKSENRLWGDVFGKFHEITKAWTQDRLAGLVVVTDEIAKSYRHTNKMIATIPNSMWGEPYPLPPTANKTPTFVFVGSPMTVGINWHGIDKLITLARALPESTFHIVGPSAREFSCGNLPANMIVHGELRGAELIDVFSQSDVGLGTMALHRKDMDEACPLKVRDYLMHGLPVVIGYWETETQLNTAEYVLQIGNTDGNVENSIDAIAQFADLWRGRRVTADLSFMTRGVIEWRRINFLMKIAKGSVEFGAQAS